MKRQKSVMCQQYSLAVWTVHMFRHSEITPVVRFNTTRNEVISTPQVGLDTYNVLADSLAHWLSKWSLPRGPH